MSRYRGVFPGLLLALLIVTAYVPVFRAGFIWDDDTHLTENAAVASPDGLRQIWTHGTPVYYPLTFTTFWAERKLWGLAPIGYHLVNISLHCVNAVLLWLLLRRLRVPGAWFAAAIFALHPVHVESVAWVTELKNCLSGMFYLLALGGYLRFEEGEGRRWYWTALCLFLLALLSKTAICTLPAALLLMRWYKGREIDRRALLDVLPFFALAGALAVATVHVEHGPGVGAGTPEFHLTVAQRVLVAGHALWFYAAKLAWPARLAFVYERWQVDPRAPSQWLWVLAALAAAVALWRLRDRLGRGSVAGVFFFAVTLAPVLSFISFYYSRYSFVADHFQYVPSIGLIAAATGIAAHRLSGRRRVAASLGAVVLLLLGSATWRRAHAFRDRQTLWLDVLSKNANSYLAHNNLGVELTAQGKLAEATAHFEQALRLQPFYYEAHSNLGLALGRMGRDDEAIAHLQEALRLKPDFADAHCHLGQIFEKRGELAAAVEQLNEALRLRPSFSEAQNSLGVALFKQGRTSEAIAHHQESLRLNPNNAEAHNNLAMALGREGKDDEALAHLREALRLKPDLVEAHCNLGQILVSHGDIAAAKEHLLEALRLKASYPEAHNNLGMALFKQGRSAEAVAHYRESLRLNPNNSEAHNNLGMALFTGGHAAQAVAEYRSALLLKPDSSLAHNNLGMALLTLGSPAEAAGEFERAIQLQPAYSEAHGNLAAALGGLGRKDEALAQLKEAIRVKPESPQAHYNLGLRYHQDGRIADAIAQYEEALRIRQDDFEARNNLGVALLASGRAADAVAQYRQALRANPNYPYAHSNMGQALQSLGRTVEAMEQYQQALTLKPDYVEAHYGLGTCLDALNRPAEALVHFETAIRLAPGFTPARERAERDRRAPARL